MKQALVTGGNRGIGKAIAAGLRDAGMHVIIGARDPDQGRAAAAELGVHFKRLDLDDHTSINEAKAWVGQLDVLVNNAGILEDVALFDDGPNFARSMQVMVNGPYELIRNTLEGMRANGYGRIVNVSSEWGSFSEGLGGGGGYAVAKAALNALTLRASQELPDTIKINAMCPGWVRTRMGGPFATREPEQAAKTAIWLATLPQDGPTGGFFRDKQPIEW
ncbi:NAD(P)-dependent dehydrogenase (short-subunit alcohol dehydrogenase family) [Litoreibacter ponti]|uniref:NAD(P)-dependent dehydrogenase (Short-subunit alcohol dehydrogenase family) n=1 Tax=Litoreibacter ponti TaxID=1510457 RepID=A0A2T6BDD3_9RHOB|nr:SDR family NAD(P)-dependent oxidoreductase [Litoreibacter ponti]PTX54064.1 NAD(P)-dependent dehydrogenase (short-subunit alcohol dehydrogenase family) [Litoreibacter ponti]